MLTKARDVVSKHWSAFGKKDLRVISTRTQPILVVNLPVFEKFVISLD